MASDITDLLKEISLKLEDLPVGSPKVLPQTNGIFTLPTFSGDIDDTCLTFNEFVDHFDLIGRALNWTDKQKANIFPIHLRQHALECFRNLPAPIKTDYRTMVSELGALLQPPDAQRAAASTLHNRKQEVCETVANFSSAIRIWFV